MTQQARYSEAKQHFNIALQGFVEAKDPTGIAMTQRNLGTACFITGDLDAASSWLASALATIENQGKPDLEHDIQARNALVISARGDTAKARKVLQECLAYWNEQNHPRWPVETKLQLAIVERDANRLPEARKLLEECSAAFARIGDLANKQEADQLLAQIKLKSPSSGGTRGSSTDRE